MMDDNVLLVLANNTNNFNISNTADTIATLNSIDTYPPLADAITTSPAIFPPENDEDNDDVDEMNDNSNGVDGAAVTDPSSAYAGGSLYAATNARARTMQQQQPLYTLGVSKHYFDVMEDQSGKDYRWIKPLQQPFSKVML